MNNSESAGTVTNEGPLESFLEKERDLKVRIMEAVHADNFDEVIRLSAALGESQKDFERVEAKRRRDEDLPARLREIIAGMEERIAEIEDGSFIISDTDPTLKQTILKNIRERLEITIEDLSIAEGVTPAYESQTEMLIQEIEGLIEPYARRWEELVNSGNKDEMIAFAEGRDFGMLYYEKGTPYENALQEVRSNITMAAEGGGYRVSERGLRDNLIKYKQKLERALNPSETPSQG